MLRVESDSGWWLITHQDHARLAGEIAACWGNDIFCAPTPRAEVLEGIRVHDDGWVGRDAQPEITREGKPAAFSHELVGRYSAFEEIDLAAYLRVRERALAKVETRCAYAALLVCMHTTNLLTERADRTTIAPHQLPLLDSFLARMGAQQQALRSAVRSDAHFLPEEVSDQTILDNFRLLQAADNLSLLGCVAYAQPANLLHPLRTRTGATRITVEPRGPRSFQLTPWPFPSGALALTISARHVEGRRFPSAAALAAGFHAAPVQSLTITLQG